MEFLLYFNDENIKYKYLIKMYIKLFIHLPHKLQILSF